MSDFSRTLQPAGSGAAVGSDHAWGNHQFIVGGGRTGHSIYGTYPTLRLGGPDDTDGGSARAVVGYRQRRSSSTLRRLLHGMDCHRAIFRQCFL